VFHIRDMMQSEFSFCNVSLCTRSCNKEAHCLAIYGSYVLDVGSCIYMSEDLSKVINSGGNGRNCIRNSGSGPLPLLL
jgi:hypothetical protein